MNFQETINELYRATRSVTVYVAQANNYINGENVPSLGIRSFFAGYKNNDPIIDGNSFMICGDVYFRNGKKISDIYDLNDFWTYNSEYVVMLRAVCGFPTVTVDLGKYEVITKSSKDDNGNITMELVRV